MLQTNIGRLKLKRPTILAAGLLGTHKSLLLRVEREGGSGAVTTKSITLEPRVGHNNPIMVETEAGWLNAVGYSNPGLEHAQKEFADLSEFNEPVIGSLVAGDADEYVQLAEGVKDLKFSALELPLSCPHTPGFGLLAGQGTPEATYDIVKAVRAVTKLPLILKISPNIPALGAVVKAAEKGGADAIAAGNTLGPGMVIDIATASPVLDFKFGGMSGPAVKPIAVRVVYDVYQAVDIPVIGIGGITTGADAIEMMMAGATAVGVGTAIHYRGIPVFKQIHAEMENLLEKYGYSSAKEIIGIANDKGAKK